MDLSISKRNKINVGLESETTVQLAGSQGIFSLDFIAKQAYQAVQQLAVDMGQPQIVPWESASVATQESTKAGVLFYIQNPTATAEQVHESWMARKASEGWSCGDTKDETNKTHPCMRPYGELDIQHKLKDHIFMYVVNAFIEAYGEEATNKISVGEPNADWYENTMPGIEGFFDFFFKKKEHDGHMTSKETQSFIVKAIKQIDLTYGNANWLNTAKLITTPITIAPTESKYLSINGKFPTDLVAAVKKNISFYSSTLLSLQKIENEYFERIHSVYRLMKQKGYEVDDILIQLRTEQKNIHTRLITKIKLPNDLFGNPSVYVRNNISHAMDTSIQFTVPSVSTNPISFTEDQIKELANSFVDLVKAGFKAEQNEEQHYESFSFEELGEEWDLDDLLDNEDENEDQIESINELSYFLVNVETSYFNLVNPFIKNLNHVSAALDSLLFKLIKPTMKVPGVESDFSPTVRYAGVETFYNTTMDIDLDESAPGVEGIGDIFSSIGKWFRNINAEKVDGNVNALLSPETVKMINATIRRPSWRKEQELKRGKISSPRVAPMLGLPGKLKSSDFLNNIKDSESKLKQLLPGYLKAISEHSDAIVAINKKAKVDWGQAKDSDAKIEIIKQALAAIRALEHPTTYYAKMKIETIGCIVPFALNGDAGWKRDQDVDFPKEIDALTPEQFNAACDRFIEIYDEFKQPTSEFFDKIISAAEYVPVSTGGPFWDLIKKETNGGKLYLNYGLSCVTSKQVESLVYDSVFALWYQFSLRGLIAWISSSVH